MVRVPGVAKVAKVRSARFVRNVNGLQTVAGLTPEQPGVKGATWADRMTQFLHQASAKLELQRRREAEIAGRETWPLGKRYFDAPEACDEFDSTAISAIRYNHTLGRLTITFKTGRTYDYFNVSAQRYRAFCAADSKGRYFNQNIRHGYAYTRRG